MGGGRSLLSLGTLWSEGLQLGGGWGAPPSPASCSAMAGAELWPCPLCLPRSRGAQMSRTPLSDLRSALLAPPLPGLHPRPEPFPLPDLLPHHRCTWRSCTQRLVSVALKKFPFDEGARGCLQGVQSPTVGCSWGDRGGFGAGEACTHSPEPSDPVQRAGAVGSGLGSPHSLLTPSGTREVRGSIIHFPQQATGAQQRGLGPGASGLVVWALPTALPSSPFTLFLPHLQFSPPTQGPGSPQPRDTAFCNVCSRLVAPLGRVDELYPSHQSWIRVSSPPAV